MGSCALYCLEGLGPGVEQEAFACLDGITEATCTREAFQTLPRCPYSLQWGMGACAGCFRYGMRYEDSGGPQVTTQAASAMQCQGHCAASGRCAFFSYTTEGGACALLGSGSVLLPNSSGTISGPKTCPGLAAGFQGQQRQQAVSATGRCCVFCLDGLGPEATAQAKPFTCQDDVLLDACSADSFSVLPRCPYVVRWSDHSDEGRRSAWWSWPLISLAIGALFCLPFACHQAGLCGAKQTSAWNGGEASSVSSGTDSG